MKKLLILLVVMQMAVLASISEASTVGRTPARKEAVAKADEIERNVKRIIQEYLVLADKDLVDKNRLIVDLGADEIDIAEMVMLIEKQFNIIISDAELDRIIEKGTIDGLIRIVRSKVAAR